MDKPVIPKLCIANCHNSLSKLSKFPFSNCQKFPFQTVKISLFKLPKLSSFKLLKFSFSNSQKFTFQTVKNSPFRTVKIFLFKLSKFPFSNCQNFSKSLGNTGINCVQLTKSFNPFQTNVSTMIFHPHQDQNNKKQHQQKMNSSHIPITKKFNNPKIHDQEK